MTVTLSLFADFGLIFSFLIGTLALLKLLQKHRSEWSVTRRLAKYWDEPTISERKPE